MDNQMGAPEGGPPVQILHRPKRPLSAYNLFFQAERQKIVSAESNVKDPSEKVKFADMAKIIGAKWKKIDPETKRHFESLAEEEKARHKRALSEWRKMSKQSHKRASVSSQGSSTGRVTETLPDQSASLEEQPNAHVQSNSSIEPYAFSRGPSMAVDQSQNSQLVSFQNQSGFVQAPASWSFMPQFAHQNAAQAAQMYPSNNAVLQQGTTNTSAAEADTVNSSQQDSQQSTQRLHEGLNELAEVLEEDCVEWLVGAFRP